MLLPRKAKKISGANIINIQGCNIDRLDVKQNMYIQVDTRVLQEVFSSVELSQDLESEIENIVEAESPNLDLSGGTKAETFTKMVTKLSTRLQNEVGAECAQDANTTNTFGGSDGRRPGAKRPRRGYGSPNGSPSDYRHLKDVRGGRA